MNRTLPSFRKGSWVLPFKSSRSRTLNSPRKSARLSCHQHRSCFNSISPRMSSRPSRNWGILQMWNKSSSGWLWRTFRNTTTYPISWNTWLIRWFVCNPSQSWNFWSERRPGVWRGSSTNTSWQIISWLMKSKRLRKHPFQKHRRSSQNLWEHLKLNSPRRIKLPVAIWCCHLRSRTSQSVLYQYQPIHFPLLCRHLKIGDPSTNSSQQSSSGGKVIYDLDKDDDFDEEDPDDDLDIWWGFK